MIDAHISGDPVRRGKLSDLEGMAPRGLIVKIRHRPIHELAGLTAVLDLLIGKTAVPLAAVGEYIIEVLQALASLEGHAKTPNSVCALKLKECVCQS